MPNLKPPVTSTDAAVAYRESIMKALPTDSKFTPLMTLYLTDTTSPQEIKLASEYNFLYGCCMPIVLNLEIIIFFFSQFLVQLKYGLDTSL